MPEKSAFDAPWLDPDELSVWFQLQALVEYVPAAVDAQLRRDSGLTRYEYYVMAMLSESPGRRRLMTELAMVTNASLSRLSHAVAKLESRGWLTRATSPADGRATVATLTDSGMTKIEESAPGHAAEVRRLVFDGLTPQQTRALRSALMPVIRGLDLPEIALRAGAGPTACEQAR